MAPPSWTGILIGFAGRRCVRIRAFSGQKDTSAFLVIGAMSNSATSASVNWQESRHRPGSLNQLLNNVLRSAAGGCHEYKAKWRVEAWMHFSQWVLKGGLSLQSLSLLLLCLFGFNATAGEF